MARCSCGAASFPPQRPAPKGSCLHIPTRQCASRNSRARGITWSAATAMLAGSMVQPMYGSDGSDRQALAKAAAACILIIWSSPRPEQTGLAQIMLLWLTLQGFDGAETHSFPASAQPV